MKVSNIAVSFKGKKVLEDISAEFKRGEITSIIGPNGTGKSTLVKAISELVNYSGSIEILNGSEKLARDKIAYVPQMTVATSNLTVFEMVLLGQMKELRWKISQKQINETLNILDEIGIRHLCYYRFSKLSGGERQLVIMAQALVAKPKVILLDEPTSALDIRHQLQVLDIAKKYTKKNNAITIVVIHDLALAARYSSQIILLNKGYVIKKGSPTDVLEAELLKGVYKVNVDVSLSKKGYITVTPIDTCKIS